MSALEKDEGWDGIGFVMGGEQRGFVDLCFAEFDASPVFFFDFLYHRLHHGTFAAPYGVEHDNDRKGAAPCLGGKVFGCQMLHNTYLSWS